MYLRVFGLFAAVLVAAATGYGQAVATPAVPLVGQPITTLAVAGEPATTPTHFVAYPVDPQHLFVMSLDSHATSDLLTSR